MIRLRAYSRLRTNTQGMALPEFGLILIPLMIVLLGAFDLGYQSYVRAQLQGVLNNVARAATVENPDFAGYTGATTEARIENAIRTRVDDIARNATYTIEQSNFYQFSGVGKSEKLITDHNGNGQFDASHHDCWQDLDGDNNFDTNAGRSGQGGADDVVFYEVTLTMPRLLPVTSLYGVPNNYTIRARAAVRNQPFANQVQPATVCA